MNFFITVLVVLCSDFLGFSNAINCTVDGPKEFRDLTLRATYPFVSDKVKEHSYFEMYGTFLLPRIAQIRSENRGFRFLEIGAGCSIPAKKKGVDIWNELFQLDNTSSINEKNVVWIAELKKKCVDKMKNAGTIPLSLHDFFVYGNQGNELHLREWVTTTGGNFDAIVDDGSHRNDHLFTSLVYLWKHALRPGGMYFLEDLQVGRNTDFSGKINTNSYISDNHHKPTVESEVILVDVIKDFIEQLVIPKSSNDTKRWTYPISLIPGIKSIYCQAEACVLFKCKEMDIARCFR